MTTATAPKRRDRSSPSLDPSILAAERSLLGATLTAAARGEHELPLAEVRQAGLQVADLPQLGLIFGAMQRLDAQGKVPDTAAVTGELERTGELSLVGGAAVVSGLVDGLPDERRIPEWARTLRRAALERRAPALAGVLGTDPAAADELVGILHELRELAAGRIRLAEGELLSEVEVEAVTWLWKGRVPLGKLTILDGDPGMGKSTILLDLAARVSRGRAMPDGFPGVPGGVVILTAEDGLADTVRPRLDAAGADCSRIVALTTIEATDGPRPVTLPDDLEHVRAAIARVGAVLVIVDPLMAYLAGPVDAHRDKDIRRALMPLAQLAEETGVAIVLIRHLVKSGGVNPLYRGGGSIGIVGACRSGLLVCTDPEVEGARILSSTKSNLSAPPASLTYVLEAPNDVLRIRWTGTSAHTAASLLEAGSDQEERGATTEAKAFLQDLLRDGPRSAHDVKQECEAAGLAWRTVKRAKANLEIACHKAGGRGGWTWELKGAKGSQGKNTGPLGPLGPLGASSSSSSSFQKTSRASGGEEGQGGHPASAGGVGPLGGEEEGPELPPEEPGVEV
jgi:RecA-family ATPase